MPVKEVTFQAKSFFSCTRTVFFIPIIGIHVLVNNRIYSETTQNFLIQIISHSACISCQLRFSRVNYSSWFQFFFYYYLDNFLAALSNLPFRMKRPFQNVINFPHLKMTKLLLITSTLYLLSFDVSGEFSNLIQKAYLATSSTVFWTL